MTGAGADLASFALDIPILLPAAGWLAARLCRGLAEPARTRRSRALLAAVLLGFWLVAGGLYFDLLNIEPLLGAPGRGNHFMWNSGVELLGVAPLREGGASYRPFLSAANLAALFLFAAAYPAALWAGYRIGVRS